MRASPAAPPDIPAPNDTRFYAYTQESHGQWKYLRSAKGIPAKIVTSQFSIEADDINYNSATHVANARGHMKFEHFVNGDNSRPITASTISKRRKASFTKSAGLHDKNRASPRPPDHDDAVLFEGKWAERLKDRYVVHDGFLTDCRVPKPWWRLHAPVFDIIPDDRAIARNAVFTLKGVPMLYLPIFYRPLGQNDRQSGFLPRTSATVLCLDS